MPRRLRTTDRESGSEDAACAALTIAQYVSDTEAAVRPREYLRMTFPFSERPVHSADSRVALGWSL